MDAFTTASPTYRRATSFARRPLPLAAFEVAEAPRRAPYLKVGLVFLFGLAGLASMVIALGALGS